MGQREVEPRLKELWDKGISVYSFSKLSTIDDCLYNAYLNYVLRKKSKESAYTICGSSIHDKLEALMNNECTEEDLESSIDDTLVEMEVLGIDFPKDREGGSSIKDGWIADMLHFCRTYVKPKGQFEMEVFFLYETPKHRFLQGYQDLIQIHKDGSISIYDYKTSSMFKGEDIKHKGMQLVIYALAKEQEGFHVKKIAWIMLKYAEVRFTGKKTIKSKNESEISKVIERKNLVKDLSKYIINKLEKLGKDDLEIELIMNKAMEDNEIPEEVKDQFKVIPYVMNYELTDEVREECIAWIDNTIDKWESLDKKNESLFTPKKFTRIQKNGKEVEDSFFCGQLCGMDCHYFKDHRDQWNNRGKDDEFDDLFG